MWGLIKWGIDPWGLGEISLEKCNNVVTLHSLEQHISKFSCIGCSKCIQLEFCAFSNIGTNISVSTEIVYCNLINTACTTHLQLGKQCSVSIMYLIVVETKKENVNELVLEGVNEVIYETYEQLSNTSKVVSNVILGQILLKAISKNRRLIEFLIRLFR